MLLGCSIANRVSEMLMDGESHSTIVEEIHLLTACSMKVESADSTSYRDFLDFVEDNGVEDVFPPALLTAIRTMDRQQPKLAAV